MKIAINYAIIATNESKDVSTIIGERFKACRIQAGLTQQEVASILGIRQVSVLGWEKGKALPRADKLSEIAALYHTTVDYLLGKEGRKRNAASGCN